MPAINFISYLRVSTSRQGEHGLGVDAQREAVRSYVHSVGGVLLEEHVEVETGRSATRPILLRSIAQCRAKKATLVIAKLDRLARSVSFISSLMDGGVEFVATDMPAANKFMLHLMSAFAEFERDQIAARTKSALAAAKKRGVVLGKYGKVLAERHRADALAHAEDMREPFSVAMRAGAATLSGIAVHLTESGYTTREGAAWSPGSVQRVMKRLHLQTPLMC